MLAEKVWWERLRRAAKRKGREGSKAMSDWARDVLAVLDADKEGLELVDGRWRPIPAERFTEHYKQRQVRRLADEVGVGLGVGPMPPGSSCASAFTNGEQAAFEQQGPS